MFPVYLHSPPVFNFSCSTSFPSSPSDSSGLFFSSFLKWASILNTVQFHFCRWDWGEKTLHSVGIGDGMCWLCCLMKYWIRPSILQLTLLHILMWSFQCFYLFSLLVFLLAVFSFSLSSNHYVFYFLVVFPLIYHFYHFSAV